MVTGIYYIKNEVTKAVYIGQSLDIPRRWNEHLTDLFDGTHTNSHLQHAFDKYGYSKFQFQVYTTCDPEHLNWIEKFLIFSCRLRGVGVYNVTDGGDSSPMSDEHKRKIGEGNIGKVRSEETRAKLSAALKAYYAEHENPFKGKTHDEETRQKMSAAKQGKSWTLAQYESRKQ